MHASVMDFLRESLTRADIEGMEVLEVGSMDLNGSPRQVVLPLRPLRYVGVDTGPGAGVDLVCDASNLTENVGEFAWDVVISTEMLEHAQDWRRAVNEMKRAVRGRPGGLLVVTTRGPGFPYHAHPDDYWRFTTADFQRIFADFDIEVLKDDPGHGFPGVLMKARRTRARYPIDLSTIEVAPVERPAS
jgi:SAM-dependent methyltransferase